MSVLWILKTLLLGHTESVQISIEQMWWGKDAEDAIDLASDNNCTYLWILRSLSLVSGNRCRPEFSVKKKGLFAEFEAIVFRMWCVRMSLRLAWSPERMRLRYRICDLSNVLPYEVQCRGMFEMSCLHVVSVSMLSKSACSSWPESGYSCLSIDIYHMASSWRSM
jgi:hypothetical protein